MKKSSARARVLALMCAASTVALDAAIAPKTAQADDATASSERIVVTARRRAESAIRVPAAVTAFTETDIESAGITSARDYIALTPNVTLVETQNAGTAFVVIRGISQARNSEPSVAVIIDGVQQTNPSQFTQELVDIAQIEVIRGPQGALYGRNAIGGAINITTRGPTDVWEGTLKAGVDNGFGYNLGARASGPITDQLGFAGGVSWRDTDGYLENAFLGEDADPVEDLAGRARLVFEPNDEWTLDLRGTFDQYRGRSLYFVVDQEILLDQIFGGDSQFDVNDTSIPITVDNRGQNDRNIYGVSFRTEYAVDDWGTLTSTSSWDSLDEILTGDQYDFKPAPESLNAFFGGPDFTQSQYLEVENLSQELRFVSPDEQRLRYVIGAYYVKTERYISTGNLTDTGDGAIAIYKAPRQLAPFGPQQTFLADSQDNEAWALFGDVTTDLTDTLELSVAARYDVDRREQTTLTLPQFLTDLPQAKSGEVRDHTFSAFQPKITLRYSPTDDLSVYGGYSRGFRSGGFNQSGVADAAAMAGIVGVGDLFLAEVANTYEIGFKSEFAGGRFALNGAAYHTKSHNPYFFVFLSSNSTQNLGNIEEVEYQGVELDGVARLTDAFSVDFGVGLTDSEITKFADPTAIGNQAPLVSEYTVNVGAQYFAPLADTGFDLRARADLQRIGDTYWEPYNTTVRDPVDLVDVRVGVENDVWALTAWSKNLFDEEYNAEYSPGGFLFKALPRRYGVELTRTF